MSESGGNRITPTGPTRTFFISDILEGNDDAKVGRKDFGDSDGIVATLKRSESPESRKSRKARTIFSDKQLQSLEESFEKQKYLSVQDRLDIAQRLNLSDTQVKTWYQNRRTKWKRQTAVGFELLAEAGNFAAVQRLIQSSPYWSSYMGSPRPVMSSSLFSPIGVNSIGLQSRQPNSSDSPTTTSTTNILGFPSVRCR